VVLGSKACGQLVICVLYDLVTRALGHASCSSVPCELRASGCAAGYSCGLEERAPEKFLHARGWKSAQCCYWLMACPRLAMCWEGRGMTCSDDVCMPAGLLAYWLTYSCCKTSSERWEGSSIHDRWLKLPSSSGAVGPIQLNLPECDLVQKPMSRANPVCSSV
jgi:hypothetical protein